MHNAKPTRGRKQFAFRRDCLPSPLPYYENQGITLSGGGAWKDALCPFHQDHKPSLRIHIETGGFRCMACGAHGRDVLAFHMLRHDLPFIVAVKALGAWRAA